MAVNNQRRPSGLRRSERGLDLQRIVEEAWAIVDANGVNGLSTRTLAAALGVKSPALYWHVKNKEELLSLMLEQLLYQSLTENADGVDWKDWLKQVGRRQRDLLLSHRDAGIIASIAPPTERLRTEVFPMIFQPMLTAGISPLHASCTAGALAALVFGWVVYEQRPETREFVESFQSSNDGFEFALDALVRGVADKVREAPTDSSA